MKVQVTSTRVWSEPFRDDVQAALAMFHGRSLEAITTRMSQLPRRVTG